MQTLELKAIYENVNSYYKKAHVIFNNNKIILKSYYTLILEYNKKSKKIKFLSHDKEDFTQTTIRHINEFLQQFTNEGIKRKKELLQLAKAK